MTVRLPTMIGGEKSAKGEDDMEGLKSLLVTLLECGYADLSVLDDVGYDLGEIADDLSAVGIKPTLNAITDEIFSRGQREVGEAVEEAIRWRKEELAEIGSESPDDADELRCGQLEQEIAELKTLSAEEDIYWYCNCLDTGVWFLNNEEVYRKYLPDELSAIEDKMGFSF